MSASEYISLFKNKKIARRVKPSELSKIVGAVSMIEPLISEGTQESIVFKVNKYGYDMFVGVC